MGEPFRCNEHVADFIDVEADRVLEGRERS
jgi:hypothetical protein